MKTFEIDFNNYITAMPEDIDCIILEVPEKKILFGLIKSEIDLSFHSIKIENISFSDSLKIDQSKNLIFLEINTPGYQDRATAFENIHIQTTQFAIQIKLDKTAIRDYAGSDGKSKEIISFDVVSKATPTSTSVVKSFSFEVKFKRASSDFEINFERESTLIDDIEYRNKGEIVFGYVSLYCASKFSYAEPINECKLSLITSHNRNSIFKFADWDTILSLYKNNNSNLSILGKVVDSEVIIYGIEPLTKINIPVLVDFTNIENPANPISFNGKVSVVYSKQGNEAIKSLDVSLNVIPDTRFTSLMAEIDALTGYKRIETNNIFLDNRYQWLGADATGSSTCFTFRLGNYAENGSGNVIIDNLSISLAHAKNSTSPLVISGIDKGQTKDVSFYDKDLYQIFKINNNPISSLKTRYSFDNRIRSYEEFNLGFRFDTIREIPNDIAEIECSLSFDYIITQSGVLQDTKRFDTCVHFKIEKNLGDHWLAVDFGTSAIVTAFADGDAMTKSKVKDLILDMQHTLESYNPKAKENTSEKGTKFLSSEMLLRSSQDGRPVYLESTNYLNDIIHLSPTKDELAQYSNFAIPYLKSLIGGNEIPDFSGELKKLRYARNERSEIVSFQDKPLEVESVLTNTYNIIIRDFVEKVVREIDALNKLNKVILTIPNTFTPKHIDSIKGVFKSNFVNFKPDYIDFLSESDAVACHYVSNWEMMNYGRKDLYDFGDKDEYVLVYDIGAGTTDITYLKIGKNSNGEKELNIIGKLGKTTAGNFLDYTIACILELIVPNNPNYTAINRSNVESARNIKYAIRDFIKPNLDNDISFGIDFGGNFTEKLDGGYEIQMKDIVEHPLMLKYVAENASELFNI